MSSSSSSQHTVADKLVELLVSHGIRYVFAVPGEENAELCMAIERSRGKLKYMICRHEQEAAFIADAMARMTGKPEMVLVTLGPGSTNAVTGIANAYLDAVPMILVTGQADTYRMHRSSFQLIDAVSMFKPICRFTEPIRVIDSMNEVVAKAWRKATGLGIFRGPSHIELSRDVSKEKISAEKWSEIKPLELRPLESEFFYPNEGSVQSAVRLLRDAKRPLMLVGQHILQHDDALKAVRSFVERHRIYTINTSNAKGIVDRDSPYCLFTAGFNATAKTLVGAVEQADLVMVCGFEQSEWPPESWNKNHKTIINIDYTPTEVNSHFIPKVEIVGDIAQAMTMLSKQLQSVPAGRGAASDASAGGDVFAGVRHKMLEQFAEFKDDNDVKAGLKPQKILWELRRSMGSKDVLVSDVGNHMLFISRYFQCHEPRTCLMSSGLASMGYGLPAAIGVKLAQPDRLVVNISGDGGFLMNCQAMATARHFGTNIICIVWVDSEYGMIKWEQQSEYEGHTFGTKFTNPDFVRMAESFGWAGLKCNENFASVFQKAKELTKNQPVLIEVPIDYSVDDRLRQ